MALIEWDDKLVIGINRIDNQHKELIRIVNELHEAMKSGKGNEKAMETVHFLVKYTVDHFVAEEAMMKHYGYPDYSVHKIQHDNLVTDVAELIRQIESGHTLLTVKIANFLADWVKEHIIANDLKLGAFLKAKVGNIE